MTIKILAAQRLRAAHNIRAGRETGQGAGMLPYCPGTNRFLLMQRSDTCDQPGTWCGLGGGIEEGESPDEAVRREAWEEAQFPEDSPCDLQYVGCQEQPDFRFHNFLGLVGEEFTPILNDEHVDHKWLEWDDFPEAMHPKMMEAFDTEEGRRLLNQHCGIDF